MAAHSDDDAFAIEELEALAHVNALVKKTARQLQRVTWAAREMWLGSKWPVTEKDVSKMILRSLRKQGVLAVSESRDGEAHVSAGVFERGGAAWTGVWVFSERRKGKLRKEILRQAERGELAASWKRAADDSWILSAKTRVRDLDGGAHSISTWGIARMGELARAGVLELLSRAANDGDDPT